MSNPNATPAGPDIAALPLSGIPEALFPAAETLEPMRVYLDPAVHAQMVAHALENNRIELCGVMLGELYRDGAGPFLVIDAAIRGEHAENQNAQVTFTHETWAHIHAEMDSKHAGRRMVGWYHTHPGFGIFLSGMDLFIHENFFNTPDSVAFVIDPQSRDEGFFCWKKGKVERMRYYWVGGQERRLPPAMTAGSGGIEQQVGSLQLQVDQLFRAHRRVRARLQFVIYCLPLLTALLILSFIRTFNASSTTPPVEVGPSLPANPGLQSTPQATPQITPQITPNITPQITAQATPAMTPKPTLPPTATQSMQPVPPRRGTQAVQTPMPSSKPQSTPH